MIIWFLTESNNKIENIKKANVQFPYKLSHFILNIHLYSSMELFFSLIWNYNYFV